MVDRFAYISNDEKQKHFYKLNDYRGKLMKEPDLKQLFLEMTLNCNEHCLHCGSNCGVGVENDIPLTDLEIISFLAGLKSDLEALGKKLPFLNVTGGEPMLRPHLYEIMQAAKAMGYKWGMTSNGLLIDEKAAMKLKEAGMSSIAISLDGTKDVHNWFRQNSKAYDLALNAIKILSKFNFYDVMVTTVVHPRNINELDEIKKIVLSTGCSTWRIINLDPIGRALENKDLYLTSEQYKYMLDYIIAEREKNDINVISGCNYYLGLDYERKIRPWYFFCQAGLTVASIQYNGDISACLDIERRPELTFGNIRKVRFIDIWQNSFKIFRTERNCSNSECVGCDGVSNCHGGGWHTWDFDKDKPKFCLYSKLKDNSLGSQILDYLEETSESDDLVKERNNIKERRRTQRKAFFKYKRHLKKLSGYGYMSGAYYCEPWRDKTRKPRYKKLSRGKRSSCIKKVCNRKFRRSTKDLYNRGLYRSVTEFWWEYD